MSQSLHAITLATCNAIKAERYEDIPFKIEVVADPENDTTLAVFNVGQEGMHTESIQVVDVDDFLANSDDYLGDSPYMTDDFKAEHGNTDQFISNVGCCHWEVDDNKIYISGLFVHPRLRGKGHGKFVLLLCLKAIWQRHPGRTIVLNANPHPTVSKSGGLDTAALVKFYCSDGIFQTLNSFADDFGFARIGSSQIRKQSPWARKPRLARKVKKLGQTCLIATGNNIDAEAGDIYHSILNLAPAMAMGNWALAE